MELAIAGLLVFPTRRKYVLARQVVAADALTALHRRVSRTRLKLQERYEGKTVLVVTHMTPVKSFIRQGLGANADMFKHLFLDLASISVVDFYGDYGVVRCVNDVAHHR